MGSPADQNRIQENSYILLVDNHTHSLKALFKNLVFSGLNVEWFDTAKEALEFVRNNTIDLIVSQITLTDSDISEFRKMAGSLGYGGHMIACSTDPLALTAIDHFDPKFRYVIKDLGNFSEIKELIKLLSPRQHATFLENNPVVKWEQRHKLIIPSVPDFIERSINYILSKINTFDRIHPHLTGIRMALSEAMANAIEHGNRFDPHKHLQLQVIIRPDRLLISVADEGAGYNYKNIPNNIEELNKSFSTRGRGLFFIQKFMDEVKFIHPGNIIVMVKYLKEANDGKKEKLKSP